MKREDFKEIKEEHFEVCREIIEKEGTCLRVDCNKCPFYVMNVVSCIPCGEDERYEEDLQFLKFAKEFLKFENEDTAPRYLEEEDYEQTQIVVDGDKNCRNCVWNGTRNHKCYSCESYSNWEEKVEEYNQVKEVFADLGLSNEVEKEEVKVDPTNPDHYKTGGIETIDYMKAKLGKEGFEGYLAGNILKYVSRYKHKNGLEDVKKARWYVERLISEMEGDNE